MCVARTAEDSRDRGHNDDDDDARESRCGSMSDQTVNPNFFQKPGDGESSDGEI